MPVSVVCESTAANVNAALLESLGSSIGSGYGADDSKIKSNLDDDDDLQSKLVASAKRVLLSKIEYEEVPNYGQAMLDKLKAKYIVLSPDGNGGYTSNENNKNGGNLKESTATCVNDGSNSNSSVSGGSSGSRNNNNNNNNQTNNNKTSGMNGFVADTNGNNSSSNGSGGGGGGTTSSKQQQRANTNELPQPKRILYPRESVRIGWKNSTRKWQVGVGMMNVGNTCYLNSTLQAIFHVPSMANWLLSDSAHMERCDAADAGCIICAMAKTLMASQTSQSAIRPYFVYSKLKSICKHLVMGRQEDAHEFLRYLMEAMEKSYLSRFRNFKDLDQFSKETTPLNQILGGYLKSAVRCLACGHVSVTFQHFQDLLLDIRKADTVEEALDGYFSRERLEDMGYKCEACKKKVSATKQFSLERAPIALCIQLKRFSMLGTKINKQITIKPRLDLTKFCSRKNSEQQLTYKLVAMVTHLGASQHCGHYTAIGLTESGTYYNYDDSYVRPISVQSVCNTNAYIIFYEMDTSPARHNVTSTQVSGAAETQKENYQKVNGCVAGMSPTTAHYNSGRQSPQRSMGAQLQTSGLTSPFGNNNHNNNNNNNNSNGNRSNIPLTTNGNKQQLVNSRHSSSMPANSSKIMIHFKNSSAAATTKTSPTPIKPNGTASSSSSSSSTTLGYGGGSSSLSTNSNTQMQSSLLTGTGKFQESAHTKSSLAGSSNKGQTATISKCGESSSDDDDDDDNANKVSLTSATQKLRSPNGGDGASTKNSRITLPSMPKLFEHSHLLSHDHLPMPEVYVKSTQKSLVPYDSGSEEDDDDDDGGAHTSVSKAISTTKIATDGIRNPLKRASSSSADDDDAECSDTSKLKKSSLHTATTTTNSSKSSQSSTSTSQQSKQSKLKTDAIDEIFNMGKRSSSSNHASSDSHSNNNGNNRAAGTTSPSKKLKNNSSQRMVVAPRASDVDGSDEDENSSGFFLHDKHSSFKRSHSTPPSPPVIKTKTGLWQVTTLQPVTASISPPESSKLPPTYKNPKNPFATNPNKNDLFTKRPKSEKQQRASSATAGVRGNGYHGDAVSDSTVAELLKQSHRGYGEQVMTWDGTESEIQKQVKEEARQQRRRDWEEEDENDMDRGRQKKVKSHKETPISTPGYNPFQEQDNQRRWKNGGHRFYGGGGNFRRNNFQRNRGGGAFKRFNYKYQQRSQQRNGGNDHHRRTS